MSTLSLGLFYPEFKPVISFTRFSVCPEIPLFLSFRQFSGRNLLWDGNRFPPTNCGNDNRTDTIKSPRYINKEFLYPSIPNPFKEAEK